MTTGNPASARDGTTNDIDALVREAERAYGARSLKEASEYVSRALSIDNRHARANWIAGNIAQDEGALERAISRYRRAVRANGQFVEAMNDLGTAYHAKGWHGEAEQCFRDAMRMDPLHTAAIENLAAAVRAQGRYKEARNLFLQVLWARVRGAAARFVGLGRNANRTAQTSPELPPAAETLRQARALIKAGKTAEAKRLLEPLAEANVEDAGSTHLLGMIALGSGDADKALALLSRAAELRSSIPEYQVDLGNAYIASKQYGKGLECYRVALALDPEYAAAAANIGKVLYDLGHYEAAASAYRDSLEMDPAFASIRVNLAATLITIGKLEDALAIAQSALASEPASVSARIVLAKAHLDLGNAADAFSILQEAERLAPDDAEVQRSLAEYWLNGPGDIGKAKEHLERAGSAAPSDLKVRMLMSYVLVQEGKLKEGFALYETRKELPERRSNYSIIPYPFWDGTPLEGKGIVIVAEQGLGDEIMFATCIADLRRQTRRIALLCSRRLEALFRRSFPDIEILGGSHVSADDRYPVPAGYELQVAAGSLPHFLRNDAESFPSNPAFLRPSDARMRFWRERIDGLGRGPKVGISWRGGSSLTGKGRRTLSLSQLEPVLRVAGINWVSIQYGDCIDDIQAARRGLGIPIAHWQEAVDDLDETAALMSSLDLCVSVCNTQIHIAGGLGREAWILAPRMPDWRYGMSGDRMLWYPTARMFRQQTAGDWSVPVQSLAAALGSRFGH